MLAGNKWWLVVYVPRSKHALLMISGIRLNTLVYEEFTLLKSLVKYFQNLIKRTYGSKINFQARETKVHTRGRDCETMDIKINERVAAFWGATWRRARILPGYTR